MLALRPSAVFLVAGVCLAIGGPNVAITPSSCPAGELGTSQLQASASRSPAGLVASVPQAATGGLTSNTAWRHAAFNPPPRREKSTWDLALLSQGKKLFPNAGPVAVVVVLLAGVVWLMTRKHPECHEHNVPVVRAGGEGGEEVETDIMSTRALMRRQRVPNVTDAMTYKAHGLMTWDVFFGYSFAVWQSAGVGDMAKRLLRVSIFTSMIELLLASDPAALNPLRFAQIGVVLNVFVGLLLGFFLASSTTRWFECVSGFLTLGNSVRNLQMQLHALGADQSHCDLAVRYGVVSAWLLNFQLRTLGKPPSEQQAAKDAMWKTMQESPSQFAKLLPEEVEKLKNVSDYPGLIWIWVGSLVGRMSNDGEIPNMASPTYGRIVQLAQEAQTSMRKARSLTVVQMPFAYVHTLATIVHINNLLSAVSFGLTLGACFGSLLIHLDPRLHVWNAEPHPAHFVIEDFQFMTIQFFKCFLAPVVYQSFFEIGLGIAQPFSRMDGAIPVERLLRKLEADLSDADRLLREPPHWEKPCYKETTAPKKP